MLSKRPLRTGLALLAALILSLAGFSLAEEIEAAQVDQAVEEVELALGEVPEEPAEEVPAEEDIHEEAPELVQAAAYCAHSFNNGVCGRCGAISAPVLPQSLVMGVKESRAAALSFSLPAGQTAVTYATSNAKVVAVDANGTLTAKKKGKATVTVTAANGASAQMSVQVLKKPSSIKLAVDSATLGVGETYALQVVLSRKSGGGVSFSSSNPAVASVDMNGNVTAASIGTAKITATLYTGKKATFTATVKAAPTSADIQLSPEADVVGVGQIIDIPVVYANDCGGTVNYSVNSDSALLDPETARLKGVKAGTAVVTATAYNGVSATATVEIQAAPTKVTVVNAPGKLGVGDTWQLGVQLYAGKTPCEGGYTFKSNKSGVVNVDENGMLTAKKAGTAKITVTAYNKKKTTIKVKVLKKPTSIKLSSAALKLAVGKSAQLKVALSKKSYSSVSFATSDATVATVDATGVVKAVSDGTVTITATTGNGLSAKCAVTVGTGVSAPGSADPGTWKSKVVTMDWYKGGSDVLKKNQYGYIYDIKTGIVVKIKRMGGSNHADVEPATAEDTKKLLAVAGGKFDWDSHAVILYANGKYVACAINTLPHGDQTITNNNYNGQFCLHMVNSKTHGTGKVNVEHQAAIRTAYNWARGK